MLLLGSWAAQPLAATDHESIHPLPSPGAPEWADQMFAQIGRHTRYQVVHTDLERDTESEPAYLAISDCAASGKIVQLSDIDLLRTPILSWSWKIVHGLDISDEQTREGDDFAARVYVIFAFDPASASLRERFSHALYSGLLRRPAPGSALNYVFASHLPKNTSWPNPSQASAHMIALRSHSGAAAVPADSEEGWYHESVDVLGDHGRLIGRPRGPEVVAVAIMTDSDATCATASAMYARFRFQSRPPSPEGDEGTPKDTP